MNQAAEEIQHSVRRSCRQSPCATTPLSRIVIVSVAFLVIVLPSIVQQVHSFVPTSTKVGFSMASKEFITKSDRRSINVFQRFNGVSKQLYRDNGSSNTRAQVVDEVRKEWVNKSVSYYTKISREERRRRLGQVDPAVLDTQEYQYQFETQAKRHYFALCKIRQGKPEQAELIYRRIIEDIKSEHEECDNSKLAVTTLLLALHLQRNGDTAKETRSVFLNFFREVLEHTKNDPHHECTCSAKVLQAFALFEMKQGNALKSLEIVNRAVRMDKTLRPVLNWKQFRDVRELKRERMQLRKLRRSQQQEKKRCQLQQ